MSPLSCPIVYAEKNLVIIISKNTGIFLKPDANYESV
jgi:hypothetical protein